jgi:uncharacterized surface protein with fasciclin (FAS1) repeats
MEGTKVKHMKKTFQILAALAMIFLMSCKNSTQTTADPSATEPNSDAGQATVKDDASMKDIVKVAVGSPDHTTLVSALKQADLVDVLANPGPFTVFAPTNEAFDKLPKGTLDDLMKPEKKADLQNILQYHVTTSSLKADYFKDGQTIGMVNGDNIVVSVKDGKIILNNSAAVIASVQASNGMVHIIDGVLLPPTKK